MQYDDGFVTWYKTSTNASNITMVTGRIGDENTLWVIDEDSRKWGQECSCPEVQWCPIMRTVDDVDDSDWWQDVLMSQYDKDRDREQLMSMTDEEDSRWWGSEWCGQWMMKI